VRERCAETTIALHREASQSIDEVKMRVDRKNFRIQAKCDSGQNKVAKR
jgi:hypothetical protein